MTTPIEQQHDALELCGADVEVPLVTGATAPYVNLDYAASAPALRAVAAAVDAFADWYSAVQRGAGWKSHVATTAYAGARAAVAEFAGAREDDVVVFVRNTTDALNLLSRCLPPDTTVVAFESEHHANLLAWRAGADVRYLELPATPEEAPERVREALREIGGTAVVTVTGASNVTGELWPVAEIAAVAREHGARVVLDAAQLAPHRALDMAELDVDWVALSGHKLYAPFGAGALVGRRDWLDAGAPYLAGGGAVRSVRLDHVDWCAAPERHEAGSPNVVGAVAMGVACDTLGAAGMDAVAAHEQELLARAAERLHDLPEVVTYDLWGPEHPRVGIVTLNVRGMETALVAAALAAEHGIGVRHGRFCAHPLMARLAVRAGADVADVGAQRAIRASFGLATTLEHVDRFFDALATLAHDGPHWTYAPRDATEYAPTPDPRTCPEVPFRT